MANSLPLPTNNTSVVARLILVEKPGDKKKERRKKNVTVYAVSYWDMHKSSFLEGRFIPLYIQTGSLPYLY
jgi:hypothetical protein